MEVQHQRVGEWLGLPAMGTAAEVVGVVEARLAPQVIRRLTALGLERKEIDAVVIPSRTLQHRRSRREKLTLEESDRVLRAVRVLAQAESVYGSRERALGWLRRSQPRLEGRTPMSLLRTDAGSRMVEELLVQIDEGIFV